MLAALSRQPGHPLLTAKIMEDALKHDSPSVAEAVGAAFLAARGSGLPGSLPPKIPTVVAALWIESLSQLGASARLLDDYRGLESGLRKGLLYGHEVSEMFEEGSSETVVQFEMPGPDFALAAILEGQDAFAAEALAALGAARTEECSLTAWDVGNETMKGRLAFRRDALQRFLEKPREDPFDFLVQVETRNDIWRGPLWDRALGSYCTREGYGAVASTSWVRIKWWRDRDIQAKEAEAEFVPEPIRARVRENLAAFKTAMAGLDQKARDEVLIPSEDPVHAKIAALLNRPPLRANVEQPLPAGTQPSDAMNEGAFEKLERESRKFQLPEGFRPVRIERSGSRVTAIGLGQDMDPVGEISGGGYWLLSSEDKGKSWHAPAYLGLRMYQPYWVCPVSKLPLWDGDHLRLEVQVQELDEQSVSFPPVGLSAKRVAKGLYLDFALEAITRDSDEDGLTDLAEDRLVLDPALKDTDGDGIEDGKDGLPQVPLAADPPRLPSASALAAALHAFGLEESPNSFREPGSPRGRFTLPDIGCTLIVTCGFC